MGLLYLRGRTIQEVGGEMMMGSSIYGVAVIDGSLYSRVYGYVSFLKLCIIPLRNYVSGHNCYGYWHSVIFSCTMHYHLVN